MGVGQTDVSYHLQAWRRSASSSRSMPPPQHPPPSSISVDNDKWTQEDTSIQKVHVCYDCIEKILSGQLLPKNYTLYGATENCYN